ncbi:MAG: carboxymuconolactone decarboxylase family protein [Dehalococcoidia bacterium]|nr:carboxymuconolactone decarboxylase family protein [Dehalococcoidia bacterium]
MTRIPLPARDDLPDELKERWDRTATCGPVLNIQRAFFNNPAIETNALRVWRASGLDPRARELVILRCAYRKDSRYEWHQHVRIARNEGLADDDIRAVAAWPNSDRFTDDERVLLAYVDELAAVQRASDTVFDAFAKGRSPAEIFGVTYLITLYFQLAQVMANFDLETEDPFVGWDLAGS